MKKSSLVLLAFIALASLQACRTNPSGPSEPVNMASYVDGSLVDVTGSWKLSTNPPSCVTMTITASGLQWFANGRLPYRGVVDETLNRSIVTKINGVERTATIYGISIDDEWWTMAVRNQDSLSIGPCDSDPQRALIQGNYVRVK